jgi:hypothetical protein
MVLLCSVHWKDTKDSEIKVLAPAPTEELRTGGEAERKQNYT